MIEVLEAKRRGALALLAALFLLATLSVLRVSPYVALLPLFLAVFTYVGYAQEARRVLGEEAARRLGLTFSPKPELPALPLLPGEKPKAYGEHRGEVLGRPFRRFEVQVYGGRRFGTVRYRFTGVLYEVALPSSFPPLHLAPRGWPTYPGERWPFLLALLGLSGGFLALLARHLAGLPVLKPGTSPLFLLAFPALYALVLLSLGLAQGVLMGRASVVDGDTLEIRGVRIRLWGIDAVESSQVCLDASGKPWPCGRRAAFALADFLGQRTVRCERRDTDRYGRVVAVCHVGGVEVNRWLVEQGWALAYVEYGGSVYLQAQRQAQAARRGVWQGTLPAPLGVPKEPRER
jgi:endonuclease YncB( thermonuclease family)